VGLLYRGFQTRDPTFLKQAYLTYIRPLLEYCSNAWNPHLKKLINAIENVQRHFTKRIPSLQSLTYLERLAFLDLESLELRRLKSDLTLYYNIWHNHSSIPFIDHFNLSTFNQSTRSSNTARLTKDITGPTYLNHHFFNRAIECWNSLPVSIINCPSVRSFKNKLTDIDRLPFLVGNCYV
jgi:hypothetical protein